MNRPVSSVPSVPRVTAITTVTAALGLMLASSATAQTGTLTAVGTIPGPAELVRAAGTQAYVVAGKTLTVYDIANPAAPTRRGVYEFPEKVWGFRVYGSLLYVANGFNGLQILDVANPDKPVLHGAAKTQGQSKNVSVAGGRAVVANHMTGVDVIDVSDSTKPAYLGSAFVDGYARDAAIAGATAYAVDNPSGFYVLDVSTVTSKNVEPASNIQEAHTPQHIELSEAGRLAVLAGGEPFDPKRAPRPAGTVPRGTLQILGAHGTGDAEACGALSDAWPRPPRDIAGCAGLRRRLGRRRACRRSLDTGETGGGRQLQDAGAGASHCRHRFDRARRHRRTAGGRRSADQRYHHPDARAIDAIEM